jgi:hypothetical protein
MRAFISIENEKAILFENEIQSFLIDSDLEFRIRERDFMTDFIFDECTEEEEEMLNHFAMEFNSGN